MLRHDLTRIRLMSALYFLISFLFLTLPFLLTAYHLMERYPEAESYSVYMLGATPIYTLISMLCFPFFSCLFAMVLAASLMGYCFNRRASEMCIRDRFWA